MKLALLSLLLCTSANAAPVKIAVLPTKLEKAAAKQVPAIIDDLVMTAVQRAGDFQVVGREDIADLIGFEKQKDLMGCDDVSCVAQIGGALGVEKIVSVKVDMVKDRWVVTSKLINIRGVSVEARSSDFVQGDVGALLEAVPSFVGKLFGAKTAAPVAARPQPQGLVLALDFTELDGGVVRDTSPARNNATVRGNVTFAAGLTGNGARFDGASGDLTTPIGETLPQTLVAWVKPDANAGVQFMTVIDSDRCGNHGMGIELSYASMAARSYQLDTHNGFYETGQRAIYGAWQMVAAVYKRGRAEFYFNGELVSSIEYTQHALDGQAYTIGSHCGGEGSAPWKGAMDDVRIYNAALDATDIRELYEARAAAAQQANAAARPKLPEGTYRLQNVNSGRCLDVGSESKDDGARVVQWDCHNGANQQWTITPMSDGTVKLTAKHSGKCLEIGWPGRNNGEFAVQNVCHHGITAEWIPAPLSNDTYFFVSKSGGRCLDVDGGRKDNAAGAFHWQCHGAANQQWKLLPVR